MKFNLDLCILGTLQHLGEWDTSNENYLLESKGDLIEIASVWKGETCGWHWPAYWPSVNWSVPRSTGRDWSSWSAMATSCWRSVTVSLVADISLSSFGESGIFSFSTLLDPIVEMSPAVLLISEPSLSKFTTYRAIVLLDLQEEDEKMPSAAKSVTGRGLILQKTNKNTRNQNILHSVQIMQI